MRVVAGTAKGRKLKSPASSGTRPVMDRVKTALFDILAYRIRDTRFLDLFGGTGSIGIEALSRGAAEATFIELDGPAIRCIRENLAITGLGARSLVLRTDAFAFLRQANIDGRRYDIVYLAPPQYQGLAARALVELDAAPLVPADGLVIAQIHPRERGDLDGLKLQRLQRTDERRYGSTLLVFYELVEETAESDTETDSIQVAAGQAGQKPR
jgi:16S rRNA (guanine(966)-N(2))-methyltransferase RsmD